MASVSVGWGRKLKVPPLRRRVGSGSGRDDRVGAGGGMLPCHRLSAANKARLSLCHGDSRVFTTAGRVISSLSAAIIAAGCLPLPTSLRVRGGTSHPKIAKSAIFRMGHPRSFVQYGYRVFKGSAFAEQLTASLAKEYANPSPAQILLGGTNGGLRRGNFFSWVYPAMVGPDRRLTLVHGCSFREERHPSG